MKIIQCIAGIDNLAAGPSYTVPRLCRSLAEQQAQVELFVLSPVPTDFKPNGYSIKEFPTGGGSLGKTIGLSPKMAARLASITTDIVHSHGLWLMPNIYACRLSKRDKRRIMVSPRGMLSPWALQHSKWRKKAMWMVLQRKALSQASSFHATAFSELEDIRRLGLRAPVAVIPNGIDIPELPVESETRERRRLLFLARIHKKKGLDILLKAWARLENRFEDWELVVAGPDEGGYLAEVQGIAATLHLTRVSFVGPVYGMVKSRLLNSSDVYVLPTHSENFAMTVAEALAYGMPAVVTQGAPWSGLVTQGCGWWIELGEESVAACLGEVMARDRESLRAMGAQGRAWMKRDFSWETVGARMVTTYRWLVEGGAQPAWVDCDD